MQKKEKQEENTSIFTKIYLKLQNYSFDMYDDYIRVKSFF